MRVTSAGVEASYVLGFCRAEELSDPGALAARWLLPQERSALDRFPAEKRRRDWLAGRVAAKHAFGAREVELVNDAAGRPFAFRDGEPLPFSVSVTHCALGAAAAVSAGPQPVGCDWEPTAPRETRVIELFTDPSERGGLDDDAATRLWTRKEAVLKLLGVGLGALPSDVRFSDGSREPRFFGSAEAPWRKLGAPRVAVTDRREDGAWLSVAHVLQEEPTHGH